MIDLALIALVAAALVLGSYMGYWPIPLKLKSTPKDAQKSASSTKPVLEGHHPDGRKFGVWEPVAFDYPKFEPHLNYSLTDTQPPPYRAFRYTQKKMTMGIMSYPPDEWIILDKNWQKYHEHRKGRMLKLGDLAFQYKPEVKPHVWEACQEISEFVSRKYPHIYTVTRFDNTKGWYGEGEIMTISIPAFGAHFDLRKDDPLFVAGCIQPSDINMMVEESDGQVYLKASVTTTGGSSRLEDKFGRSLSAIHIKGHVPHYKRDLETSMNRYFARAKPGKDIFRVNFTFALDNELSWSEKLRGPFEDFDVTTRKPKVGTKAYETWKEPQPAKNAEELFLRQERQVLRRLPKTGALVFMAHAYLLPVPSLMNEPGLPGRLASVLESWPPEIVKQKSAHMYLDCLIPYLRKHHERQVAEGICKDGELPTNFPFN